MTTYISLVDNVWTVYGENTNTGEQSILTITKKALKCDCDFEWAMLVHETITKKTNYCDTYPAPDAIAYTKVMGDGDAFDWVQRVQKNDCNQEISVDGSDVTFSWDHSM